MTSATNRAKEFYARLGCRLDVTPSANGNDDHIWRKRNTAKLDLNADNRRRRRIDQTCLILYFTNATAPGGIGRR